MRVLYFLFFIHVLKDENGFSISAAFVCCRWMFQTLRHLPKGNYFIFIFFFNFTEIKKSSFLFRRHRVLLWREPEDDRKVGGQSPQIFFLFFFFPFFPSLVWFSQSKLMDDLVYFCVAVEARDQNGALIVTATPDTHTHKYIHFNPWIIPAFWNTTYP